MRKNMIRSTAFSAVRMAHRWPWRPGGVGLVVAAAGAGLAHLGLDPAVYAAPAGLAVTGAVTGWWWLRHVVTPRTSRELVARRTALSDRAGGMAIRLDVAEVAGPAALRRLAVVLRPSLAEASWWQRHRLDPRTVGVEVARSGWHRAPGGSVWSSSEDATARVGGPRTGKTLGLVLYGLDAPGALVTTSTRLDLAEMLHAHRSERGPVWVFNPTGLGGLASTVRWRVLSGCERFDVACRRADDLIPVTADAGEGQRWDAQACRVLALLLHAAGRVGPVDVRCPPQAGGDHDACRGRPGAAVGDRGDRAGSGACATNDRPGRASPRPWPPPCRGSVMISPGLWATPSG